MKHLLFISLTLIGWSVTNAQSTVLQEDFNVWPLEGWSDYQTNVGTGWGPCWQSECGLGGNGLAAYNFLCNGGCDKWLVTPLLNVSTSNTELKFWERFDANSIEYYDYSSVEISIGSGNPLDGEFVEVFTNGAGSLPLDWSERTIDLSTYLGEDVYIAFHFTGTWHEWFVDDLSFAPANFTDAGITDFVNPIGTNPALGPQDVIVRIENFGTEAIDSYVINWTVNGSAQTPLTMTSASLQSGEGMEMTLGTYDFNVEGDYEIIASLDLAGDFNPSNNESLNIFYVTSEKDASITSIYPNGYYPSPGMIDVAVEISNLGENVITDIVVQWQVDGVEQVDFQASGFNIASGSSELVTIGQYSFTQGTHEIVADVNASGEVNPENDMRLDYAAIDVFFESFEGAEYPPEGWSVNWGLKETNFAPTVHGVSYHLAQTDNNFFGEVIDTLFTPVLEVEVGDEFSFYRRFNSFFPGQLNMVWKDGLTGDVSVIQSGVTSEANVYSQVTIDLSSVAGIGQVGFAFSSPNSADQAIDLITSDANIYQWPNDIAVKRFDSDYLARSGSSHPVQVTIKNLGANPVLGSSYSVNLKTIDGTELASTDGVNLEVYEQTTLQIEYDFSELGEYEIYAEIDFGMDDYAPNNSSRPEKIHAVPEDVVLVDVGTPEYPDLNFPFDFGGDAWTFSTNDISQSLFYQDELDQAGLIYGMTYYGRNIITTYQSFPLQVWVSTTDLDNLSDGWDVQDDLVLLFDDTLEIGPGTFQEIYIPFETPILYSNLNNLIVQHYAYDAGWPPAFGGIWTTGVEGGPDRVVRVLNSLEADPNDYPQTYGLSKSYSYTTFVIQPIEQLATVSGTVFDENDTPLTDATISIADDLISTTSDVNGDYALPALPFSSYSIIAEAYGYNDNVQTITADQQTVDLDFYMDLRPEVIVNASVVGSNAPSIPLGQVVANAEGYESYTTITEGDGIISFDEVYGNSEYAITFSKYGYYDSTITVAIQDLGIDIGTIELQQEFISPYIVSASIDGSSVNVTWEDPITSSKEKLQEDSDFTSFSYTNEVNENVWLGNRFASSTPVTLQSVEVYWDFYLLDSGEVTIDILDENGAVITTSEPFMTLVDTLMTIDVPNVTVNGDFYAMVHWQDNPASTHALRIDWSFGVNNSAYIKYPSGNPSLLSNFLGVSEGSFLVRANVLSEDSNSGNSPLSYNIYSGDPMDISGVSGWSLLNSEPVLSSDYVDIPPMEGPIMYAIEAVYVEGVSEPSFSNGLDFAVGIEYQDIISDLSIYPNPTSGSTWLSLELQSEQQVSVQIMNALGQVVHERPVENVVRLQESLDLSHLDNGIYWIDIRIGTGRHVEKLAIHR